MAETVKKPWGSEYLLYQNDNVAIWHLFINPYHKTSLHSHPNKKTGLLVLDGAAKVSFLGGDNKLFYGEKIMIRQGVFHQTTCMTSGVLQLLEIETPVNKEDIVRLEDSYGRTGSVYMGDRGDYVKEIELENDNIGRCNVFYTDLKKGLEFKNFMITEGAITHMDYEVAGPGDILNYGNMHKLLDKFDLVKTIKGIAVC